MVIDYLEANVKNATLDVNIVLQLHIYVVIALMVIDYLEAVARHVTLDANLVPQPDIDVVIAL